MNKIKFVLLYMPMSIYELLYGVSIRGIGYELSIDLGLIHEELQRICFLVS